MGIRWNGRVASAFRRGVASVALIAQAALLVAPLADVHDAAAAGPGALTAVSAAGEIGIAAQQSHGRAHDPATCPACIAQSLHINFERPVAMPAVVIAPAAPIDPRAAGRPQRGPPATHQSRAPPLAV
ncbi:MAG: hypothetical protein ACREL5_04015 [Gemmatimonadales bacterium]